MRLAGPESVNKGTTCRVTVVLTRGLRVETLGSGGDCGEWDSWNSALGQGGHVAKWTRCCWTSEGPVHLNCYVRTSAFKICHLILEENKDINSEARCVRDKV